MLRTVLFDFDCTLADSSRGIVECVHYALRTLGLPEAPQRRILETIGLTLPEALSVLTGVTDAAVAADFSRLFRDRADAVMVSRAVVYDGVEPALNTLRTWGLSLGIVSSKRRQYIESILANHGLQSYFDVIIGWEDVSLYKPDPSGLWLSLSRLGATAADALYVGDHPIDGETARRAGVRFVAVLSGVSACDDFRGHQVLAFLQHLGELPQVVDAIRHPHLE